MTATRDWNRYNRAIRAACNKRGISEDERKLTMESVTGKTSSKDCTSDELRQVLVSLNENTTEAKPFKPSSKKHVRYIWALWGELATQGKLRAETKDERRAALVAFVNDKAKKTYTLPDQLNWLTYKEADPVIRALKDWVAR
ncbi:regulatory protein GemA [Terasakiella sp. A23]|uniref:regulatory protein GemA n=1 Tax=Terasakiella sp. FCG-A23 TaxID=3080561 RepID=UPI0029546CEE|nr:regulatory protein GemA [Terasakiella sp. A23]MDV7340990.1 regulatory protein GemA [Terasakiella sp. A23]